jgi:hypothetical protein
MLDFSGHTARTDVPGRSADTGAPRTRSVTQRASLGLVLLFVSGCSSVPPAARPGLWAAGAVVAASILFRVAGDDESSGQPDDLGCFEEIENGHTEAICPP